MTCGDITEAQKPYCINHTTENTYASQVVSKLKEIEHQDQAALDGRPELTNVTAQDLIIYLKNYGGPIALTALLATFNPNQNLTKIYLDLLLKENLVRVEEVKKTRGNKTYQSITYIGV